MRKKKRWWMELTVKCTITCKYGGVIGFMDAGQGVY